MKTKTAQKAFIAVGIISLICSAVMLGYAIWHKVFLSVFTLTLERMHQEYRVIVRNNQQDVALPEITFNTLIVLSCAGICWALFGIYVARKGQKVLLLAHAAVGMLIICVGIAMISVAALNGLLDSKNLQGSELPTLANYRYVPTALGKDGELLLNTNGMLGLVEEREWTSIVYMDTLQAVLGCCGTQKNGSYAAWEEFLKQGSVYRLRESDVQLEPPVFCCEFQNPPMLIVKDPGCALSRNISEKYTNFNTEGCFDKLETIVWCWFFAIGSTAASWVTEIVLALNLYFVIKKDQPSY